MHVRSHPGCTCVLIGRASPSFVGIRSFSHFRRASPSSDHSCCISSIRSPFTCVFAFAGAGCRSSRKRTVCKGAGIGGESIVHWQATGAWCDSEKKSEWEKILTPRQDSVRSPGRLYVSDAIGGCQHCSALRDKSQARRVQGS